MSCVNFKNLVYVTLLAPSLATAGLPKSSTLDEKLARSGGFAGNTSAEVRMPPPLLLPESFPIRPIRQQNVLLLSLSLEQKELKLRLISEKYAGQSFMLVFHSNQPGDRSYQGYLLKASAKSDSFPPSLDVSTLLSSGALYRVHIQPAFDRKDAKLRKNADLHGNGFWVGPKPKNGGFMDLVLPPRSIK